VERLGDRALLVVAALHFFKSRISIGEVARPGPMLRLRGFATGPPISYGSAKSCGKDLPPKIAGQSGCTVQAALSGSAFFSPPLGLQSQLYSISPNLFERGFPIAFGSR